MAAYGRSGESYPSERVQRAAWKAAGVPLGEQVEPVWFDRETAREKNTEARWRERNAMVGRLSREGAPVHLVVTHLHLLGASFDDLNATLAAIAKPGNKITITSEDVTLPLDPGVPQLAALIVGAQTEKVKQKLAISRKSIRVKPQRKLTIDQERKIREDRAAGATYARLAEKYEVSIPTIKRTIDRGA